MIKGETLLENVESTSEGGGTDQGESKLEPKVTIVKVGGDQALEYLQIMIRKINEYIFLIIH